MNKQLNRSLKMQFDRLPPWSAIFVVLAITSVSYAQLPTEGFTYQTWNGVSTANIVEFHSGTEPTPDYEYDASFYGTNELVSDWKFVQAYSYGGTDAAGTNLTAYTECTQYLVDMVTINAPASYAGTYGTMTFRAFVQTDTDSSPRPPEAKDDGNYWFSLPQGTWGVTVNGYGDGHVFESVTEQDTLKTFALDLRATVPFNTPFKIELEVDASAQNGDTLRKVISTSSSTGTVSWGGIVSIADAQGVPQSFDFLPNPVNDGVQPAASAATLLVSSQSGTDWTQAAPEPNLAVPLILLALARRKGKGGHCLGHC